jgi:hypothetical protein
MPVDVVDPSDRDKVMMVSIRGTLFGQLDLVGAVQMTTLPTVFLSDEMTSMCSLICVVSGIGNLL